MLNPLVSPRGWLLSALVLAATCGCSVQKLAVNKIGDALAGGGTTYAADDDPEFVRAAVPFSLKLVESLLEAAPEHEGLLLTAASGFTQYSWAYLQQDAEALEREDLAAAQALRLRARRMYLRGRNYGLRGLDVRHPGIVAALREQRPDALAATGPDDVPFLHWTAVAWAAAIGVSKDDPGLIGDLALVDALIGRSMKLNSSYDSGATHSFLVTYSFAGLEPLADQVATARFHFDRAVELSDGKLAAPFVAFAESACVRMADRHAFVTTLERALAIDPDHRREWRLSNLVMQKRARWLLARVDELFLPEETR